MKKEFPIIQIDGRDEVVAFTRQPAPVLITTKEIGSLLANSCGNDQAEMLVQWAEAVDRWPLEAAMEGRKYMTSWPMQCRFIAEEMPDHLCLRVSRMLETLVEHLQAIPVERASKAQADAIVDSVAELLK